jgi:flagellar protein FliO/FliZ
MTGLGGQSLLAVLIVLALVVALAWLARRAGFGPRGRSARGVSVESAVSLGERRSLVIVSVEDRRLLLGVTPAQITVVTELDRAVPFDRHLKDAAP